MNNTKEMNVSNEIDKKMLEDIINSAVFAPSTFNLQPWEVMVARSDDAKQRLSKLVFNGPELLNAPVTLMILGDKNGFTPDKKTWSDLEAVIGKEKTESAKKCAQELFGATHERTVKFAESNAAILGMSIINSARHYGLDSHLVSGARYGDIKKEFNIDPQKHVVMLILLDFPDKFNNLNNKLKRYGYSDIVTEV